jgi:hypothetical protein
MNKTPLKDSGYATAKAASAKSAKGRERGMTPTLWVPHSSPLLAQLLSVSIQQLLSHGSSILPFVIPRACDFFGYFRQILTLTRLF